MASVNQTSKQPFKISGGISTSREMHPTQLIQVSKCLCSKCFKMLNFLRHLGKFCNQSNIAGHVSAAFDVDGNNYKCILWKMR